MSDIKMLQKLPEMHVDDIVDYLKNVDGLAIKAISKSHQTKEMAYAAVKKNGLALMYVNKKYWTEDLLYEAINSNPEVYFNIIDKTSLYMTPKLWALLAKKGYSRHIPEEYFDKDVAIEVVKYYEGNLAMIPAYKQTKDVILYAVTNYAPIDIVNASNMTVALLKEISDECPQVITFIDDINFIDEGEISYNDIYNYVVAKNPSAIQYIPQCNLCYSTCKIAVEKDSSTIQYIPAHYYYDTVVESGQDPSSGLLKTAVLDKASNIILVDCNYWETSLIEYIVKTEPSLIPSMSAKCELKGQSVKSLFAGLSDKALAIMVSLYPEMIQYVLYSKITDDMLMGVINKDSSNIEYIPTPFQTQKVQTMVVKDNPYLIEKLYHPTLLTRLIYFIEIIKRKL